MASKSKKKSFTSSEIEVLLSEIQKRKSIIFSSVSGGIKGPAKAKEWEKISAVNAVSPVGCTNKEIKKKWFNMKMASKKHLATARLSMTATGGDQGEICITEMDEKLRGIIGDAALSGISTEDVPPDTGLIQPECEDMANTPDSDGKMSNNFMLLFFLINVTASAGMK